MFFQPIGVNLQPVVVELEWGAHELVPVPGDAGQASRLHVIGIPTTVAFATLKSKFFRCKAFFT